MYDAGLVLEGGGMKGVYTAGVLDFFAEKEVNTNRPEKEKSNTLPEWRMKEVCWRCISFYV